MNLVGVARVEAEGDPILPVHADAVAAPLVALEGFQAMDHQLVESRRGVEIVQSPTDDRPEVPREPPSRGRIHALEYVLGRGIPKRPNHEYSVPRYQGML